MTNTDRETTVSLGSDTCVRGIRDCEFQGLIAGQGIEPLESASQDLTCQDSRRSNGLSQLPPASLVANRYGCNSRLRILVLNDKSLPLSENLLERVLREDPQAIIRNNWNSLCEMLADDWRSAPHVILGVSLDCGLVIRRLNELWHLRVANNYSHWPVYFAMPRNSQPGRYRFDIERLGGYFLHLFDAPNRFRAEVEQIRLMLGHLKGALPTWLIVYDGHGVTLRAVVYLVHRKKLIRVRGSDRQIAALAVFLKNNGLERSLSMWQTALADDLLFEPSGGYFRVPSIGTIKTYVHRDFPKTLQRAFDEYRSGLCADRVIERNDPGTHGTTYGIRGEWEVIRR